MARGKIGDRKCLLDSLLAKRLRRGAIPLERGVPVRAREPVGHARGDDGQHRHRHQRIDEGESCLDALHA